MLMDATRLRLLRELSQPDSASGLARRLGMPRQRINYHLRELEKSGLVRLVREQRKRNCTERILQATARSYVVSPEALAELGADAALVRDRFGWAYLVAVAARAIRELGFLRQWADHARQRLATFTLETEITFVSPAGMRSFAEDVSREIARLTAQYHDERSTGGRKFRFFLGAYPTITKPPSEQIAAADQVARRTMETENGDDDDRKGHA